MRTHLAFILLLSSAAAHAEPRTAITINPVEAVLAIPNLAVERAVSTHLSLELEGLHFSGSSTDGNGTSFSMRLSSLTFHPHVYFGAHPLSGFYLAPFVQVVDVKTNSSVEPDVVGLGAAFGATIGWAWVGDHMDLKIGAGAEVASSAVTTNDHGVDERTTWPGSGFGVTMDLSMGVAF